MRHKEYKQFKNRSLFRSSCAKTLQTTKDWRSICTKNHSFTQVVSAQMIGSHMVVETDIHGNFHKTHAANRNPEYCDKHQRYWKTPNDRGTNIETIQ